MLAPLRRARALAALGAAGLVLAVSPVARADSTGSAEQRAQALLAKVHRIQAEVKAAESAYDRSLSDVEHSVIVADLTDRAAAQAAAETDVAANDLNNQVRNIYMSGGPVAVYVSLLQSGSFEDFETRSAMMSSLVSANRQVVQADRTVVSEVAARAATANRVARRHIATERLVAQAAARVQTLLNREQSLLAQANAQVAHLQALAAAAAALRAQTAAFGTITASRLAGLQVLPPSPLYLSLYHSAATTCPGLSWTVLAAIGQVESGHGRNPSTSSAGAMGPMQFLPSTFASYAVDGNHDGVLDIMSPYDAIFTAANYLCANGAGRGPSALANAVWHYNHADWYVQMVLTLAQKYAG